MREDVIGLDPQLPDARPSMAVSAALRKDLDTRRDDMISRRRA
jgi:hypothetical protein